MKHLVRSVSAMARWRSIIRFERSLRSFASVCEAPREVSSLSKVPTLPEGFDLRGLGHHTRKAIEKAKNLHPAFYADTAYTQYEARYVFNTTWFAAAHTAELAEPGDVKVIDVAETSIVLTRCKKGLIHAFYNVCRHRGAKVCKESMKECKQLVCPYHWWTYRLDGTLKSTPPTAMQAERKEGLGLRRVPGLDIFAGVVFLNQLENPPPLSSVLGDLTEKLANYDMDRLEWHGSKKYDIKGNWKLVAENFIDYYHLNAVHPALARFSRMDDHRPYQGRGQYVGFVTEPLTDTGGAGDSNSFNPFPRINKVEKTSALFFQIFPNLSLTVYPHSVYTLIMLPGATPNETREELALLMAPEAKLAGDSDEVYCEKKEALMAFVTNVNDEDVVAIENLQSGLTNALTRNVQGEFVPEYDWCVHRYQNILLNCVEGIAWDETHCPALDNSFAKRVKACNA